jgi:hypothetical protein
MKLKNTNTKKGKKGPVFDQQAYQELYDLWMFELQRSQQLKQDLILQQRKSENYKYIIENYHRLSLSLCNLVKKEEPLNFLLQEIMESQEEIMLSLHTRFSAQHNENPVIQLLQEITRNEFFN